jgi:hypothetical protein
VSEHDPSDAQLRETFAARLDGAPEPDAAMYERTMNRIDDLPHANARPVWKSAAAWWTALALPARWALAAAVVTVGGTAAFQGVRGGALPVTYTPREALIIKRDVVPARSRAFPSPAAGMPQTQFAQIARTARIGITVGSLPLAGEQIARLAREEKGALRASDAAHIVLAVPARDFDGTMHALETLGTIRSRSVHTDDVGDALRNTSDRLAALRRKQAALLVQTHVDGVERSDQLAGQLGNVRDQIAQLESHERSLQRSVATATLTITMNLR